MACFCMFTLRRGQNRVSLLLFLESHSHLLLAQGLIHPPLSPLDHLPADRQIEQSGKQWEVETHIMTNF